MRQDANKPKLHPQLKRLWRVVHRRRWLRNSSGFALLFAGVLGPITPVLGVWMIPIGLMLLSVDFDWAQRWHTGLHHWLRHRGQRLAPAFFRPRDPKP